MESRVCWFVITVLLCKDVSVIKASTTVVVDSPFGKIEGVRKTDEVTGESYVSFQGIPYAKPPVGPLRFHKPEPHPVLDGVFDATKDDHILCPHPDQMTLGMTGFTEACLVLNIRAKDVRADDAAVKKVLVFIHGGAFTTGSGYYYPSTSFVLGQDVIVVTINYRLGILGFLSTEDEASPGNYGLWDQTLALKWVKDNIRAFGGDPEDVTIAGESAGGASVGFQMISPHTKGLFTKAYPHSGSPTSFFARSLVARSDALTLAKHAGCLGKETDYKSSLGESRAAVDCLRQTPVSVFTAYTSFSLSNIPFVPVIDGDFIPGNPHELLKDDAYLETIGFFDRSYLIAVNNHESVVLDVLIQGVKQLIFMNNETSEKEKESSLHSQLNFAKEMSLVSRFGESTASDKTIINEIDVFYARRFEDNITSFLEFASDVYFLVPSFDYVMATSRRGSCDAYFLYFDFFPTYLKGRYRGTPHGHDLLFWLDVDFNGMEMAIPAGAEGEMSAEDMELKAMFSSIIGDFMRYGNPGRSLESWLPSGWPRYDVTSSYFLRFNSRPWLSSFLEKDKQDLWLHAVPSLIRRPRQHTEL